MVTLLGRRFAMDDATPVTRNARSGVETVDRGARAKLLTFGFEVLTEADALALRELHRIAGLGGQVLCVPRPGHPSAPSEAVLGRLQRLEPIGNRFFDGFQAAFAIRQTL